MDKWYIVLISTGGIVACIPLIVLLVCCWRRSKKRTTEKCSYSLECEFTRHRAISAKSLQKNSENQSSCKSVPNKQTLTTPQTTKKKRNIRAKSPSSIETAMEGRSGNYNTLELMSVDADFCVVDSELYKPACLECADMPIYEEPDEAYCNITFTLSHWKTKRMVIRGRESGFDGTDISSVTGDLNPHGPRPIAPPPPDLIDEHMYEPYLNM